jgi:hypothetical protein
MAETSCDVGVSLMLSPTHKMADGGIGLGIIGSLR